MQYKEQAAQVRAALDGAAAAQQSVADCLRVSFDFHAVDALVLSAEQADRSVAHLLSRRQLREVRLCTLSAQRLSVA
jgi:hypothetical protein